MGVYTEVVGYVASAFVAVSLIMADVLLLRILNLIGAVVFVTYGVLIGGFPIVLANGFITLIDIYHLWRLLRPKTNGVEYVMIPVDKREMIDRFVAHYLADILRFFPDFSVERVNFCYESGGVVFAAMRDAAVVGFAIVQPVPIPESESDPILRDRYKMIHRMVGIDEHTVMVPIDYVARHLRGLGLAERLLKTIEREHVGVTRIVTPVVREARSHRRFLSRHGFRCAMEEGDALLYTRTLRAPDMV